MSSPIWLLSTRARPEACQEVLDACARTKMTSPGVVYVDETVDQYQEIELPPNWTIHYEPKWGSIGASHRWCLAEYPDATQYGWLADDQVPRTRGWDRILERKAGDWYLSYARDHWTSEANPELLQSGNLLSAGLCLGGKLIRTVGWWMLPGTIQGGNDAAWAAMLAPIGLTRYVPHVVVEHKNWRTKKREYDENDEWTRDGDNYVQRDVEVWEAWRQSDDFTQTQLRIEAAMRE